MRCLDATEELVVDEAVRLLGDRGGGGERGADGDLAGCRRRGDSHHHDARPPRHARARPCRQARGARVEVDCREVPGVCRDHLQRGGVLVLQSAPDRGARGLVAALSGGQKRAQGRRVEESRELGCGPVGQDAQLGHRGRRTPETNGGGRAGRGASRRLGSRGRGRLGRCARVPAEPPTRDDGDDRCPYEEDATQVRVGRRRAVHVVHVRRAGQAIGGHLLKHIG